MAFVGFYTPGSTISPEEPTPIINFNVEGNSFPSSLQAESSHVLKNTAGFLLGCYVTANIDGYLMIFDQSTVPVDGAVVPKHVISIAANVTGGIGFSSTPQPFATGIVAVFSTTGPFVKNSANLAFFSGIVL